MQGPCETIKSDVPTCSMKRTIQEHHNIFPERAEGVLPLGLAHPPPRGHQPLQEIKYDNKVKLMTRPRKQTGILRVLFNMVAELAIWQADLAIEFA
eukprot:1464266-Amphidinium_carterae.1